MASVTLSPTYPCVGAGPGAKTEVAEALSELSEAGDSLLLRLPRLPTSPSSHICLAFGVVSSFFLASASATRSVHISIVD